MPLIDFSTANLPHSGDFSPGQGLSTSSSTNENVLAALGQDEYVGNVIAPQANGTLAGHPVAAWLGVILLIIVLKFVAEKNGEAGAFSNVRVGFFNIAVITLSSLIGLTFLKWVFGVYKVPGISPIIEAA